MFPPKLNVKIEKWGPNFWYMYHMVAISYDEKKGIDNDNYKNCYLFFYNNFYKILPCKKCSDHFSKLNKERNVINFIDNKEMLFKWSVDNHNIVNKRLKKNELSLNRAKIEYTEQLKHNKIMKFMNYLFRLSLKYDNVGVVKKVISSLSYIIPCNKCSIGLILRLKSNNNNFKKLQTSRQLKIWFKNNHKIHIS